MKHLIITADDFGMSREVNEGVKKGIKAGIITNVSLMVNMPYFDDAVEFIKKYPYVSTGLHFNMTEGFPLLPHYKIGTLIREDGNFFNWKEAVLNLMSQKTSLNEIELELSEQYEKLRKTGINVYHIDSHHHIHLYPTIFQKFIKLARRKNIHILRCRTFRLRRIVPWIIHKPTVKQILISMMCFTDSRLYNHAKDLYEVKQLYDLNWETGLHGKKLISILENLQEGLTEIISHPAILSKSGNPNFLSARYRNLCLLLDPKIQKIIHKNNIKLFNLSDYQHHQTI